MTTRAIAVAGAGLAGLVAAARAAELGLAPVVRERAAVVGGAARFSSGVIWRHHTVEEALAACPGADPELVRLVVEGLDEAVDWLEEQGGVVVDRGTGNPRTVGRRFDLPSTFDVLAGALPDVRLEVDGLVDRRPLVVATGGFAARAARTGGLLLRAPATAEGEGIRYLAARGAELAGAEDDLYLRAMVAPPARLGPASWVTAAQLYGRVARIVDDEGRPLAHGAVDWTEIEAARAVARAPGNRAWYVVGADVLEDVLGGRTVAQSVAAARALGGVVRTGSSAAALGLPLLALDGLALPATAVRVGAGVTHTTHGVRIDAAARVLGRDGRPLPGLYAAGVDVGGLFGSGYASGLAAALVLGRRAAESAADRRLCVSGHG